MKVSAFGIVQYPLLCSRPELRRANSYPLIRQIFGFWGQLGVQCRRTIVVLLPLNEQCEFPQG